MATEKEVRAERARVKRTKPTTKSTPAAPPTSAPPTKRVLTVDTAIADTPRDNSIFAKMSRATMAYARGQLWRYNTSRSEPKVEACEVDGHVWCDNGRGTRCLRCDVTPNRR